MNALSSLSRVVSGRPVASLTAVVLLSVLLGSFAVRLEQSASFDDFETGDESARVLAEIATDFGAGGAPLQVLLDAGEGGDVLSAEALEDVEAVGEQVRSTLGDRASSEEQAFVSFAGPLRSALDQAGATEPGDDEVRTAAGVLLSTPAGAQLAGLLSSDDLDPDRPSSRAALGLVVLDARLDDEAAADAAVEVRDALDELELSAVELAVVGEPLLERASSELTATELPRLLGISVLLITLVLALVFRRVGDVLISLGGLALALVWTFGIGALLGPGWLGRTGPFNQITTVVPVLVAGLGIDFALHLINRDREEQTAHGVDRAAALAVATVGGALVLTSVTTAVGFLTNLASPLAPIRDFGVFTAVGVLSAFAVMVVVVPSARTLLDRRRERRHPERAERSGQSTPFPLVGPVARFSRTHPLVVIAATVALSAAALLGALAVPTTFSTDDFIPEQSRAADALAEVEARFGDDVSERTFVRLDGPLTEVGVAREVAALGERFAELDGVRSALGRALVDSPVSVLTEVAATEPELAEQLAPLGWDGEGFADDADVAAIYATLEQQAPERAAQVLEPDGDRQLLVLQTTAAQDGAVELQEQLLEQLEPLEQAGVELTVASQQLVFADTLDALTGSQLQSIAITVLAAALLLTAYFRWRARSWTLGLIAMLPTVLVAIWVVGTMWLLDLSFNVLTITIGSLAIAIGVDYGIHICHRFHEECERRSVEHAIQHTIERTGGSLAASAATTAAGFGVLMFSSILPIQQFGIITALTIVYSVVAAVVVLPAVLALSHRGSSPDHAAQEGRDDRDGASADLRSASATDAASRGDDRSSVGSSVR